MKQNKLALIAMHSHLICTPQSARDLGGQFVFFRLGHMGTPSHPVSHLLVVFCLLVGGRTDQEMDLIKSIYLSSYLVGQARKRPNASTNVNRRGAAQPSILDLQDLETRL